jgi:predicted N-acetyltransferase YhbS
MIVRPENSADSDAVEALYLAAFGPGQFAKAASLLRAANSPVTDASRVAVDNTGRLIGACRIWPLCSDGAACLLLGPIAVDGGHRRDGVGAKLARACLEACDRLGAGCVVLVGEISFFGQFGFAVVPKATLCLPAPVDPARLLWRHRPGAGLPSGLLRSGMGCLGHEA